MAIIAVLIAILFPVVARLRQSSRDVICQARLSKLAVASLLYRNDHRSFPRPPPPPMAAPSPAFALPILPSLLAGLLEPQKVESNVLNQLALQLGYRRITSTTAAIDLPAEVQSPDVEWIDTGRGPITISPSHTSYFTGFVYTPGVATFDASVVAPSMYRVLKPARLDLRNGGGVLWADDVQVTNAASSGDVWQFTHAKSGAAAGKQPLTYASPTDCRGQHRAYVDGSTEWVRTEELGLDASSPTAPDKSATYWTGGTYWWF